MYVLHELSSVYKSKSDPTFLVYPRGIEHCFLGFILVGKNIHDKRLQKNVWLSQTPVRKISCSSIHGMAETKVIARIPVSLSARIFDHISQYEILLYLGVFSCIFL